MADMFDQFKAESRLGQTIFNIGSTLMDEVIANKESDEYNRGISKWMDEKDDYIGWQRENASNPENYISELENRRETMQANVLEGISTPGAKRRILNKFNTDFANLKSSTEEIAHKQSQANISASFNLAYDELVSPPTPEEMSDPNWAKSRIEQLTDLIDENESKIPGLQIEGQSDAFYEEGLKQFLQYYVGQKATSEDDISNDMIEELVGKDLFNVEDIARMKKNYRAERNLEAKKEKDTYEQEQRELINDWTKRIQAKDWLPSVESERSKSKLSDANYEVWDSIVQNQDKAGTHKTNWKRYNELEKRIFDMWEGKSASEIEDIQREITEAYVIGGKKGKEGISEIEYNSLLSRLEDDIPDDVQKNMRYIYNELEKAEGFWKNEKGLKEAKDEIYDNRALYNWVKSEIMNNKMPSKTEIMKKALELKEDVFKPQSINEDLSRLSDEELIKRITGK